MTRLPYQLSPDRPDQIGLIVLQSDETLELDMRRLLPAQTELLVSRVPSGEVLTNEMIADMEGALTRAAELLPRGAPLRTVGYGCTSASAQIGSDRVAAQIRAGVDTAHVTNPAAALIAACRALGITRLALVSPYVESVSRHLRQTLQDAGIAVPRFGSFEEDVEANVVRIDAPSLIGAARQLAEGGGVDGVFLSCTNLRTLDVIAPLEEELGLPVLSSNQVLAWHMMQQAGITAPAGLPGRIWAQV